MINNKILVFAFLLVMSLTLSSAVLVNPGETLTLPQLSSNVSIDTTGIDRTYLYCTWRINGVGETAIQMTTINCPETLQTHRFTDDETFYARIDSTNFVWDTNSLEWKAFAPVLVDEIQIDYNLDLPEPAQSLFDDIVRTINRTLRSFLCTIFPSWSICG